MVNRENANEQTNKTKKEKENERQTIKKEEIKEAKKFSHFVWNVQPPADYFI